MKPYMFPLGASLTIWAVLTGGSLEDWPLGLLVCIASAWSAHRLWSPTLPWPKAARLPSFFGYFLLESCRGGWDVAKRVFAPSLPVQPDLMEYSFRLQELELQVLACWIISLLPGTAAVSLKKGVALVHQLDATENNRQRIVELEDRLAYLFGTEPLE